MPEEQSADAHVGLLQYIGSLPRVALGRGIGDVLAGYVEQYLLSLQGVCAQAQHRKQAGCHVVSPELMSHLMVQQ